MPIVTVRTEDLVIGDVVAWEGAWHELVAWAWVGGGGHDAVQLSLLLNGEEHVCTTKPDAQWRLREVG